MRVPTPIAPPPPAVPTPPVQEERWRALVQAVRAEFWRAGQDPNEFLWSLFEVRLLRGRLTGPPAEEWFSRPVADEELDRDEPAALARAFYADYRAELARRGA